MYSINVEDLVYIFYTCYGICALALVLCLISSFVRSKVLYVVSWVISVLAILASIVFTMENLGRLSLIIPTVCFFILLLRPGRKMTGTKFLIIYVLRAAMLMAALTAIVRMFAELYFESFTIRPFYPVFLLAFFNVLLGFLVFMLPVQKKIVVANSLFKPVLWSVLIGFVTWLIQWQYTIVWPPTFRKLAVSDVHFTVSEVSCQNLFLNLACWATTGIFAYFILRQRQQKLN